MSWLEALPRKHQRGSLPRCLILAEGEPAVVGERLTNLIDLDGVQVSGDVRMPHGLPIETAGGGWDVSACVEARIGKTPQFLNDTQRHDLLCWWLARPRGQVPNWDLACTATIEGQKGLVLIEAKAHAGELKIDDRCGSRNAENQASIAAAIREANAALESMVPGWNLSPHSHYQLANRFAWSWKIASLGVPVVLVYLGFLNAGEMSDQGKPFADPDEWERAVKAWSREIVPEAGWERRIELQGCPLWAVTRSIAVDLLKTR